MSSRVNRKGGGFSHFRIQAALAMAVVTGAGAVRAGSVQLGDTGLALTSPGAWAGGVPPQSTDVAVLDSALGGVTNTAYTWAVGSGTSNFWQGIQVLNPGGNVSITDAGNALFLGTGGIDMSQATRNLSINAPLGLGGTQTWSTAAGVSLVVT
ncbi:MAG TPA: hypothetical protein VHM90_01665, partial [Phycisphaerae bacterium]|nr:hypothetical protein [Phycisphaerae bacterium]